MTYPIRWPALAVSALACCFVVGCASAPPRPKPSAAAVAACRGRTEQVFNRQNRDLLSFRDDRDTPFSDSYNSGITSAGLSRRFEHDQMYSSCLTSSGAAAAGGSSFSGEDSGNTTTGTRAQ